MESNALNVCNPENSSTIYIMKKGDTKIYPSKIKKVEKIHFPNIDVYNINLEENELNVRSIINRNIEKDAKCALIYDPLIESWIYIGISKEAIKEFIKSNASKKLDEISNRMDKLQNELNKLSKEKEEIEAEINSEISESLK